MTTAATHPETLDIKVRPLVLFDGVCGLCNWFVSFILKRDRAGVFLFSPLQGETAARLLSEEERANLSTVVLMHRGRAFRHSAAVVRIFWALGGFWSLIGTLLWIVPRPVRDWGYRFVARNRYRWFGKKETCRLPTAEEIARLLP